MQGHLIRLRKAWSCQEIGAVDDPLGRLDLPLPPPSASRLPARARLMRSFSTPPLAPGREALSIRFENVPGLQSLRLNDRSISLPDPIPEDFEIAVIEMKDRNHLVLEVDFTLWISDSTLAHQPWGAIALVVTPLE